MAINPTAYSKRVLTVNSKPKRLFAQYKNIHLFGKQVSIQDRMIFTERLALMIDTGSPLFNSLGVIKKGITNLALVAAISRIEDNIDKGGSFAISLSQEPELFDSPYVNLIAAGEKGGFLSEVLNQLYLTDKKRFELNSVVKGALFYPAFLLFFSVSVIIFVILVVFPKFTDLFAALGDQLPLSTQILMAISGFMLKNWIFFLSGIFVLTIVFLSWSRKPSAKVWIDKLKLRLPYFRSIIIQYYLLITLRVLSLSIKNGVNVLDALRGCRDIVDNSIYKQFLDETADLVENGSGISAGFNKSPLIPDLVKQMVATGEETGKLAVVMSRIAEHYEGDLNKRIVLISKLAEPLMLLFMGAFVGLLVSSLILPIFQLSRAVH